VESPLTLVRRVDTKFGREEYKVKAQRNIAKKEVVAFLGGRLMEQAKVSGCTSCIRFLRMLSLESLEAQLDSLCGLMLFSAARTFFA
jgi:hypothetical protein